MRVFRHTRNIPKACRDSVVAIGNFATVDGLPRGLHAVDA